MIGWLARRDYLEKYVDVVLWGSTPARVRLASPNHLLDAMEAVSPLLPLSFPPQRSVIPITRHFTEANLDRSPQDSGLDIHRRTSRWRHRWYRSQRKKKYGTVSESCSSVPTRPRSRPLAWVRSWGRAATIPAQPPPPQTSDMDRQTAAVWRNVD